MRTHKIGETTIEYPDEISFCFNPVVINIYGHAWDYVEVTVTDIVSEISYKEKRAVRTYEQRTTIRYQVSEISAFYPDCW